MIRRTDKERIIILYYAPVLQVIIIINVKGTFVAVFKDHSVKAYGEWWRVPLIDNSAPDRSGWSA